MGKDKLEHSIKSKLSSYESAVNTDSLWAGIQTGMAESSAAVTTSTAVAKTASSVWSSKALIGLGIFAASLAVIGGLWYNSIDTSTENDLENNAKETILITDNKTNTEESSFSLNTEKSDQETKTTASDKINTFIEQENNTSSTKKSSVDQLVVSDNTHSNSTHYRTFEDIDRVASTNNNSSNSAGVDGDSNMTNKNIPSATTPIAEEDIAIDLGSNPNQASIPVSIPDTNNDDVEFTNEVVSEIPLSTSNTETTDATNSISYALLDQYRVSDLNNESDVFNLNLQLPPNKIDCPAFGSKGRKGVFIGELQAIPYYSIPRITATSELGEIWKSNKLETESYLETFQINLLGRYQLRNGLYFNAGVGYGQLDEKFEFNFNETIVTEQDDVPVIIIIRPDGMNDTIIGTGTVIQDTSAIYETFNYHRMFEFTTALGYEIPVNNSLGIYGDVGLSINISTTREGWHLLDDIEAVEFPSQNRQVFKTSTGYKLTGGIGLRYYMPGGVVLSGGPEFRSHLTNWIKDEHPIELKYFDIGLRLAVGYVF